MVRGVGIDLVSVARIADLLAGHGSRFLERCFRSSERDLAAASPDASVLVAAHWAAREAFLKALGADVRTLPYRDVEVVREAGCGPRLRLHGRARTVLDGAGGGTCHLTLDTAGDHAVAVVVIEG